MNYRSTPHSTTKESPFKRMFNREMKVRFDKLRPKGESEVQLCPSYPEPEKQFHVNEKVLARDYRSVKKTWSKATVTEIKGVNTFIVKTNEGLRWKRHTDQLRKWRAEENSVQPTINENNVATNSANIAATSSEKKNTHENNENKNGRVTAKANKKKNDNNNKNKPSTSLILPKVDLNELMRKVNERRSNKERKNRNRKSDSTDTLRRSKRQSVINKTTKT